ncbi:MULTISPECIES: TRAP transporter small permease subunit [Thalassospira]|uniref:TRAP transporter small permease subunit n=1 Tax=Thalassospira TaxID=168934 RepID=UPI000C3C65D9|nr:MULTISPECIES: TRAP transporter small permease subunit [Thalassospira]MAZ32904.1 C4-dicarboxylate ABC transporter permease [Thalassospira sp.]WOI09252.1 TRAP transporter small permease subunit [Thalassospira lucentensis]
MAPTPEKPAHSDIPPTPDLAIEPDGTPEPVPTVSGLFGRAVDKISSIFALGFLLAMGILIFEIFMRHVFNSPTLWAHETTTFLSAVGFVFGGLYCASRNKHIRVVIIYDIAGPRFRRALDIGISVVCAISSGFFAWAAWLMVKRAAFKPGGDIHLETTGSAFNAPYPGLLKIFMLFVLIALTIQFVILTINYMRAKPDYAGANSGTGTGHD